MSLQRVATAGFSTVELLISLFIAAAFIGTGFQLFSVVIQDGNEARLRSRAASVANETIQLYVNKVNNPCYPPPPFGTIGASTEGLPNAWVSVGFGCPYGQDSRTTRIQANVIYRVKAGEEITVTEVLDVTR